MPAIARTSIISGPARITFNGQNFWSKGDVTLNVINERFNIDTAHFGKVDERTSGRRIEVSFEPSGRFTAALAAVLWPYGNTAIGASIFTGSDVPLTINGRDGRQIVVHAAAITQMPSIRLGVTQTLVGQITFTGIVKNNTSPEAANAYLTESAVSYPGDSGFAVADILTKPYVANWGSSPWADFLTEGGWEISFATSFSEQRADGIGIVDMTLAGLDVTASAIPVGPTAAQILAKMAPETALGTSMATTDDLVITAEDDAVGSPIVTLCNAAMTESGLIFGREAKRVGATQWIATREIGTALFSVTAVPTP